MRIGSLNIQRAYYKKFDMIEKFVRDENLEMIALSEVDIKDGEYIPSFKGFTTMMDSGSKHRVVSYVKNSI